MEPSTNESMLPPAPIHGIDPASLSPAVCRAGYLQFSSNRTFTNNCVQSRAFFWCKSGKGSFSVNGVSYPISAQDLYILPWNRKIRYEADKAEPMFTGHVHLVPSYRIGAKWIPNVPHQAEDEAFDSPDRADAAWPGLEGVKRFRINATDNIALLLDYIIRTYLRNKGKCETEARNLGFLLVRELAHLVTVESKTPQNFPEELLRLVAHVEARYMQAVSVSELAETINRSRSHVLKLFRNHLGVSAKNFIIKRQLKQACELLLSTTRSVAEIGLAVGIQDPYHFSKLFRRHMKVSPTSFRTNHGPISLPSEKQG